MATLGYTTTGASNDLVVRPFTCKFTSSEAGEITSMTSRLWSTGSANFKFVIYSDSSGAPGSLLATSAAQAYTTTPTNYTVAISYTFAASEVLHLGVISNDNIQYNYDAGATAQFNSCGPNYTYPTPEDPASAPTDTYAREVTIYATYTPAVLTNIQGISTVQGLSTLTF